MTKYLVLDCEMTGLDIDKHQIIQIAAQVLDHNYVAIDVFSMYVRYMGGQVDPEASAIHGIDLDKISSDNFYTPDMALELFYFFCSKHSKDGLILAGYFVNEVDVPFITKTERHRKYFNKTFSAFLDIKQFVYKSGCFSIKDACEQYELPVFKEHDAMNDVLMTSSLLREMQKQGHLL